MKRSNRRLPRHTAAIHLEFEIDDRRPGKMPGQAGAHSATAHQFIHNDGMEVVHGISLHRGSVLPAIPEIAEPLLHRSDGELHLLFHGVWAEILVAHDTFRIAASAAPQFRAAGYHETRHRAG